MLCYILTYHLGESTNSLDVSLLELISGNLWFLSSSPHTQCNLSIWCVQRQIWFILMENTLSLRQTDPLSTSSTAALWINPNIELPSFPAINGFINFLSSSPNRLLMPDVSTKIVSTTFKAFTPSFSEMRSFMHHVRLPPRLINYSEILNHSSCNLHCLSVQTHLHCTARRQWWSFIENNF